VRRKKPNEQRSQRRDMIRRSESETARVGKSRDMSDVMDWREVAGRVGGGRRTGRRRKRKEGRRWCRRKVRRDEKQIKRQSRQKK
jgi:hypothetical protein